jgi:glycosyltransferase involved in cell wall biosynthesis
MHVIFVNYFDFQGPSGIHIFHLANALSEINIKSTVLVPGSLDSVKDFGKPRFNLMSFKEAAKTLRKNCAADIIHAWTPRETTRWMTERLSRRLGIPYIVHMEDNEDAILASHAAAPLITKILQGIKIPFLTKPKPLPDSKKYPEFVSRAAGATLLIESLKQFIPAHVPRIVIWPACEKKIFSIPTKPDRPLREKLGIPNHDIVITYPGNVHAANVQDVQDLYEATRLLRNKGIEISLIRMGKNHVPFKTDFSALLGNAIFELGDIPPKDIPDYLGAADILIQPGNPGPFNEYRFPSKLPMFLASGRPVILARVNIAKHLENGYNAIILNDSQSKPMAMAIEKLAQSPQQRALIGKAGRDFARQHFSWLRTAKRLASFYKFILKKNS